MPEKHAKAGSVAIGIIVNRVATAKEIYERLREEHPDTDVELVIGSMRPIDRDEQCERLAGLVGAHCRPDHREKPASSSRLSASKSGPITTSTFS